MATVQYPRAQSARRTLIATLLVLACTMGFVLTAQSSPVEASGLFGGLREPGDAFFIAGHRGDLASAPENTMPALQAALDGPMGFVEADIQLTADRVPVLMHDTWVNRTTNGEGRVDELTFEQLQRLDAGAWYSPEFAGTRVPALESLLLALGATATTDTPKKALLELKGYWTAEEVAIVTELIDRCGVRDQVILSSFDTSSLQHLEEVDPTLPRAIITARLPQDPVRFATLYGAIAIITSHASVEEDPWSVDRMHRAGLGLVLYTVNKKARWQAAMDLGVDGIITDRPSRLDHWLAASATD
jgi:glycerophosphoryl diester phosphodiesterase